MEKRYFSSTNYNLTKMLAYLKTVVESKGGYIVYEKGFNPYKNEYEVYNRTVLEAIYDCEREIERIERYNSAEKSVSERVLELRQRRLESLKRQITDLTQNQPEPFTTHFLQSIKFVYDGKLYYFQMDDNPFFPFHYQRTDINENGEALGTYLEEFSKKDWMFDCLFERETDEADIKEIADIVFNKLIESPDTEVYYESDYRYCPTCGSRMKYRHAKKFTYEKITF